MGATGIKRDRGGWRVWQRVHAGPGGLKSRRFPKSATEREMREWQEDQRVEHRKQQSTKVNGPAKRGTLKADIQRYLKLVQSMPTLKNRERDLHAWGKALGNHERAKLTAEDYRLVLQEWKRRGKFDGGSLAASSVNQRRVALMHLYSLLDGKGAPNPLRSIRPFEEPHPEPRDIGLDVALAIVGKAGENKTGARIRVLAWTGIRGTSEFGQMKREHLDLERGECWVPTGKKGQPRRLALNEHGVAAWRSVIQHKAFGHYSHSSLWRSFQVCVRKVNEERTLWLFVLALAGVRADALLLSGVRVYDLRHTIATALRRNGADLADIQAFLGHSSQKMTRRYSPYYSEKLRATVDALGNIPGNFSRQSDASPVTSVRRPASKHSKKR